MEIKVDSTLTPLGRYDPKNSTILFQKSFFYGDVKKAMQAMYKNGDGHSSSDSINHVFIHEFAHAIDMAYRQKNNVLGSDALIVKFKGYDWEDIGKAYLSEYGSAKKVSFLQRLLLNIEQADLIILKIRQKNEFMIFLLDFFQAYDYNNK